MNEREIDNFRQSGALKKYQDYIAQQNQALKQAYTHIGNYKYLALHRLIADAPENMFIDHIDHNTLNNCRDNLKICTNKENQHNRAKLEGIKETKWGFQVQMRVNGKLKCFGTYKTYEKAKEIRIKAEQEYRPYVKEINKYGK